MKTSRFLCLEWLALLTTTAALAVDPPHLLQSTPLTNVGNTQSIDVLQSPQGDITGFIGADSASRRITIWDVNGDIIRSIQLDHHPCKIVHRYSDDRDTLAIYAACKSQDILAPWGFLGVLLLTVYGDTVTSKIVWRTTTLDYECGAGRFLMRDLALRVHSDGTPVITLGFSLQIDCYAFTQGPSWSTFARTIDYSLDLDSICGEWPTTANVLADFYSGSGNEYWGYTWYKSGYDYRDSLGDPNWADDSGAVMVIGDSGAPSAVSLWKADVASLGLFAGKFDTADDKHEIIYQGTGNDWLSLHPGVTRFAACYSYAGGAITEKWFTPLSGEQFMELDTTGVSLVGMRGCSTMVALRCQDGRLAAPQNLGHCLRSVRFVERLTPAPEILLAGLQGDTVRVFGFDNVVDVPETSRPQEYRASLAQNYPNPFNSETYIGYSLPKASLVQIDVFNLLGQRVRRLVSEKREAGTHSVIWNGTSDQGQQVGSGMYLYQLRAGKYLSSRKMLLLK